MTPEPSNERKIGDLEKDMQYVLRVLDGRNNEPGLIRQVADHISEFRLWTSNWKQREEDKKLYDDRQEKRSENAAAKLNLIIGVVTVFATLALALMAILTYEHETKHTLFGQKSDYYNAEYNAVK